jgi:hypothetical protein
MSDIDKPQSETPAYKAAKLAVIILSVLIILAVIALVVGGIVKLSGKPKPVAGPSSFGLAEGARIIAMDSQPGRLILRIKTATGEEIDIIDTSDGHLVGQVKATFAK